MSVKAGYSELKELLEQAGIRHTVQRLEMARLLLSRPQHLTAEEVYELINTSFPQASRATIFNNLKLFAEKGILRTLELKPGVTLYDSNTQAHHHALHEDTGDIVDLPLDGAVEEALRKALLKKHEEVTGTALDAAEMQIVIRGVPAPRTRAKRRA